MRVIIVGAGAIGGYLGHGKCLQAGPDTAPFWAAAPVLRSWARAGLRDQKPERR